jgi:hypothetical protein
VKGIDKISTLTIEVNKRQLYEMLAQYLEGEIFAFEVEVKDIACIDEYITIKFAPKSAPRAPRAKAQEENGAGKVKCPYCENFYLPRGMNLHIRRAHPEMIEVGNGLEFIAAGEQAVIEY